MAPSPALPTVVYLRRALRLQDNPALREAALAGPVLPVYVHAPQEEGLGAAGGAARWWLHHSLAAFTRDLQAKGLRLLLRQGPVLPALLELARVSGARRVVWDRGYEPSGLARDRALKAGLEAAGLEARSVSCSLLREPWELATGQGRPYQVFTPFYRAWLKAGPSRAAASLPGVLAAPARWPSGPTLASLGLLPTRSWAAEFPLQWTPGEVGARQALGGFLEDRLAAYPRDRDSPALDAGTSRLSPHLHWGELSALQVWQAAQAAGTGAEPFLRQLAWREFSHHLLFHFPDTAEQPLRPRFKAFPWARGAAAAAAFKAWQQGLTGVPIVDAGLRQLMRTGFMHNRVRMLAASYLVKDLLVDWRRGAAWFMDRLVDGDLAQNALGWQWSAGCGADAAPYFRVLNPSLQGRRFDPAGAYVRRWVPELALLPERWIHAPWEAPAEALADGGVQLGRDYPFPIVDHAQARLRALALFKALKD